MTTSSTFTATHVIAGVTSDGKKIVFTNLVPANAGDAVGSLVIAPLTRVLGWTPGVKTLTGTGVTFGTAITGNVLSVTPSAAMTSGVGSLEIMSVGI